MADPIDVARSVEFLLGMEAARDRRNTLTVDAGIRRNQKPPASSGGSCGAIWRQWKRSRFAATKCTWLILVHRDQQYSYCPPYFFHFRDVACRQSSI